MRVERKKSKVPQIIVVVCLALIALFVFMGKAKAGTQEELDVVLGGARVVFEGGCGMKSPTEIAMSEAETKATVPCVVGKKEGQDNVLLVGLQDEKGYIRIISMDYTDPKKPVQKVLWTRKKGGNQI